MFYCIYVRVGLNQPTKNIYNWITEIKKNEKLPSHPAALNIGYLNQYLKKKQ